MPSLIQKHLVLSQSIILGHIKQENIVFAPQNHNSNKLYLTKKSNDTIYSVQNNNKASMDLTGRFPYKSSLGNEYIIIVFHVD